MRQEVLSRQSSWLLLACPVWQDGLKVFTAGQDCEHYREAS